MNTIESRKFTIDPNKEVVWETTDVTVQNREGILYTSPRLDIDPVAIFKNFYLNSKTYEPLGKSGYHGSVAATPDGYAIKQFNHDGDVDFLRANVIVAEGLDKAVPQSDDLEIRGLKIHAAFVKREPCYGPRALWLMEKVETEPHIRPELLFHLGRETEFCRRALELMGAPISSVQFDTSGNNLLRETTSDEDTARYVKIDVVPLGDFFDTY